MGAKIAGLKEQNIHLSIGPHLGADAWQAAPRDKSDHWESMLVCPRFGDLPH